MSGSLYSSPVRLPGLLGALALIITLGTGSAVSSDVPSSDAPPRDAAVTKATPSTTTPGRNSMQLRYTVGRLMRDARHQREQGNSAGAIEGMLEAARTLKQAGFEEDQVKVLREMTLDTDPAFVRAGSRGMAEYYYRKYLDNKPRDAQWLLEALGWAQYDNANTDLLKRFTARVPDKAHENIDERGKRRGEELRADDRIYQASELIRLGKLEELKQTLQGWPFDINRLHSVEGTALLHSAVWYKNTDAARLLIEQHKADCNIPDKENDTALDYARHQGANELVTYLKNRGCKEKKQYKSPEKPVVKPAPVNRQPTLDELRQKNPAALKLPEDKRKTAQAVTPATTPSSAAPSSAAASAAAVQ